jgi:hypothetical protein
MAIFAFVVDKLEEVYETPYGGLERCTCSWAKKKRGTCDGCG